MPLATVPCVRTSISPSVDVLTPNWRDRSALSLRQASDLCRRVSAWCAYPNLLFGVKSRAKVGDRGGAPVSVTEKLLARIKALFEPSRAAAPPQEIEEAPSPATPVPQLAATPPPEPITHVEEPPSIEEVPTAVAEARPLVEAAPTVVLAAPPAVEPAPPVINLPGPREASPCDSRATADRDRRSRS
jgi:hypothetical protein